jgi:ribosomal subunit interface protein
VEVIFTALHTDVQERFRKHALAKLAKIERLDSRAIRIDVDVSAERNPRQADRKERVELTVSSRGPAIRAEAAAEDRYAALDIAFAKLESRVRRNCDRRKGRHGAHAAVRLSDLPEADLASTAELPAIRLSGGGGLLAGGDTAAATAAMAAAADEADAAELATQPDPADLVEVDMQGDGPLIVREKFHAARPMNIDQALFEMELVGHDFFLFTDAVSGLPSVVYRRRGYQYGVIRLVEEHARASASGQDEAEQEAHAARQRQRGQANGQIGGGPANGRAPAQARRAARQANMTGR